VKPLQSRIVADQRTHDITVFSGILAPDNHVVAFKNPVLDHAVAFDLERKCFRSTSHFTGHGQRTFDIFFCENRCPGSDPPNDGNFFGIRESGSSGLADDVNGTCANALYVALLFQGL
jgi:hypothetical protein